MNVIFDNSNCLSTMTIEKRVKTTQRKTNVNDIVANSLITIDKIRFNFKLTIISAKMTSNSDMKFSKLFGLWLSDLMALSTQRWLPSVHCTIMNWSHQLAVFRMRHFWGTLSRACIAFSSVELLLQCLSLVFVVFVVTGVYRLKNLDRVYIVTSHLTPNGSNSSLITEML